MRQENIGKRGVIISSLFLIFTFFIFGPFQIYITNASELFFSFSDIWWTCAIVALVSLFFMTLLGWMLKGKIQELYCCVLWGIAMGLYIQGNFILTDYGTLDGAIDWGKYQGVGVWNSLIWMLCIISPVLLYKFTPETWKAIRNYLAIGILCVQIITLSTLFITADKHPNSDCQLTNAGRFELSQNENTIVFVLDAYDSQFFSDFIEQHPEYKETLWNEFTYYPDTVAGGIRTILAMPQILTGQFYTSEAPYSEYLENAYQSTELYRTLRDANYNTGIYTEGKFMSPSMSDLIMNVTTDKKRIRSYTTLTYYLYRFTACRYFPHELKKCVWMYSGDFDAALDNSGSEETSYLLDDAFFYRDLTQNGLSLQDKNAFRLYHLFGTHKPYTLDEKSQRNSEGTSLEKQQIGLMNILETYFEQMKELGIYDDANIIVLADHGEENYAQNPLLLVKKGQETKNFCVSDLPVSYTNLHPTLLSLLLKEDIAGKSIFDLTKEDNQERFFYINSADRIATEYIVRGDASDPENAYKTGRLFSVFSSKQSIKYQLGTELYFDTRATGLQYASKGFSGMEATHIWTEGYETELEIPLQKSLKDDALVSISLKWVMNTQRVGIYVNDVFLNYYLIDKPGELRFIIPAKALEHPDKLTIRLKLPDAAFPENGDPRILGIAFESMTIREKRKDDTESKIISCPYQIGDKLTFTNDNDNDSSSYFISGICKVENDFAWSLGKTSGLTLDIGNVEYDLIGEFRFKYIHAMPQRLVVRCGEQILYDQKVASNEKPVKFTVPKDSIENGKLILALEYPDAVSPFSLGKSDDRRVLAFAFSSVCFSSDQ